ncbi:hypothetical protein F5884DRAFT_878924 [Xylogone sp. PMI_703]|nr:hypothetical protein F5884DRAFT_878924 [Xylogone sp. PMI_703]
MAQYVQKALGDVYPHQTLAPPTPDLVYPPGAFIADDLFTIYPNGSVTIANSSNVLDAEWDAGSPCAAADDEDEDGNSDTVLDLTAGGFANSYSYPDDYLYQYVFWTNSSMVIPTATTALPTATPTSGPGPQWCQIFAFALMNELSGTFSSGIEVYNSSGALVYEDNVDLRTNTIVPISASSWGGPYDLTPGCTYDGTSDAFILCVYDYDGIVYQGTISTSAGVNEASNCRIYLSCR